jgi:hypothetical protein
MEGVVCRYIQWVVSRRVFAIYSAVYEFSKGVYLQFESQSCLGVVGDRPGGLSRGQVRADDARVGVRELLAGTPLGIHLGVYCA